MWALRKSYIKEDMNVASEIIEFYFFNLKQSSHGVISLLLPTIYCSPWLKLFAAFCAKVFLHWSDFSKNQNTQLGLPTWGISSCWLSSYQGRIDLNTVNTNCNIGMYFMIGIVKWWENGRTLHQVEISIKKSLGSCEISRASGMDFPIPPSFWWSSDTMHIITKLDALTIA